jgi:hypothetical protein
MAPNAPNSADILLRFLIDGKGQKDAEKALDDLKAKMGNISGPASGKDMEFFASIEKMSIRSGKSIEELMGYVNRLTTSFSGISAAQSFQILESVLANSVSGFGQATAAAANFNQQLLFTVGTMREMKMLMGPSLGQSAMPQLPAGEPTGRTYGQGFSYTAPKYGNVVEGKVIEDIGNAAAAATPKVENLNRATAGVGKSMGAGGADLNKVIGNMDAYAKRTGQTFDDVSDQVSNLARKTGVSFSEAEQQITGSNNAMETAGKTAQKTTRNIYALVGGFGSFFLSFAGKDLTRFGQMLLTPMTKFIALASGTGIGADWANTMKKIENSFARIGAIMARTLMPYLEQAASIMEDIATFAEAHPELVSAAVMTGGLSLVLGKALALLASFGMMTSALTTLNLFKNAGIGGGIVLGKVFGTALEGQTVGAGIAKAIQAKLIGGAPMVGMTLGKTIAMAFLQYAVIPFGAAVAAWEIWKFGEKTVQRLKGVKEEDIKTSSLSDLGRNAQYVFGGILISFPALLNKLGLVSEESFLKVAKLAQIIAGLGKASETGLSKEAVDAYAAYDKQRVKLEEEYENQRTQIVADAGAERVALESQYESDRNKLIADYANQTVTKTVDYTKKLETIESEYMQGGIDAWAKYQADLASLNADFKQAELEAAQDHQERLRKLAQEHADNVEHLTNTRDALGLAQENRDYKRKVDEENRQYAQDDARRHADYKRKLAELAAQYALEEAKRKEEYEKQKLEMSASYTEQAAITAQALATALAELDKKHAEEEKKLEETEKKQLSELDSAHSKQESELEQSLNDQLNTLKVWTGAMKEKYDAYYEQMKLDLDAFIKAMEEKAAAAGGTPIEGSNASGGYTTPGLWRMHGSEFTLNPSTTSMAEKLTSGRLTQGGIIGALSRAGNVIVNQTLRFSGELGASDKRQIQKIAKESAMNGVMQAMAGA